MKLSFSRLSVLVVLAGCTQIIPAPPPPDAPRIERFEAAAQVINANEPVQLSFTTVGATRVTLVDDRGETLPLEGSVSEGTAQVSPSHTTFYVLQVTGPGGVASAFLQIAVNEPLREAFLLAVPPEIEAGQSAQLLWSAQGASKVTLTERGGSPVTLTGTSGLISITPAASTGYRLTAQGVAGTPPVDALTEIRVAPAIASFDFTAANGVRVGEPVVFTWTTRAATRLSISERTLGQLTEVTATNELANGSFEFVIPAAIPSGVALTDGFPLHFTLSAISGAEQRTREVHAAVGDLPTFENVTAPTDVSTGHTFTIAWRTLNATRVAVELAGLTIFETSSAARAANGSVNLPPPTAEADYVLIASDARGQAVRRTLHIRLVAPPVITTFTAPAVLSAPSVQGVAQWVTSNAERVTLRLENGPSIFRTVTPSSVRAGSTTIQLGSTAVLSLEAVNAAGDMVTETRTVRVLGGVGTVTPQPALRNTTGSVTLGWQLGVLGVSETVGLGITAADGGVNEVVNAAAFINLSTSPSATRVSFADREDGSELLALPDGFSFPLAGQLQRELWVSANGFITFSKPAALSALTVNADLGSSSNTTQAMLAPFWDDLTLLSGGKVLTELRTSANNERVLIVQWENVKLASSAASELTFQAHLHETGRVTFAYETLVAPGNNFTVGLKTTHENVRQRLVHNGVGGPLVPGHELNFFTGGPADGTLAATTSTSRRVNFLGRTASGFLPLSLEVRTVAVGDISVTEAMPFPEVSSAATGQWVEIRNNATTPLELEGIKLISRTSDGGTLLPQRVLQPGEYFLLGQTTDTLSSGGAPVQYVMDDVSLQPLDLARFMVQGFAVASLGWDGGVNAQSVFVPEGIVVAPGSNVSCARTQSFGPLNAFGTPGAINENCSPYVVSRADAGFIPLGNGATEVLSGQSDTGWGVVNLPVPFTYFGQSFSSVNVSLGGGFFNFSSSALASNFNSNATLPSTSAPNGVVAPFWESVTRNSAQFGDGAVMVQRFPDRTVISWQDFRISGDTDSHLNFQVHLVDPNVIEFHYGSMTTASPTATHLPLPRGGSATIWLEHPNGTYAVPFSVNQERVTSFMDAVRFTPAP